MESLPSELLWRILGELSPAERLDVAGVSRAWASIISAHWRHSKRVRLSGLSDVATSRRHHLWIILAAVAPYVRELELANLELEGGVWARLPPFPRLRSLAIANCRLHHRTCRQMLAALMPNCLRSFAWRRNLVLQVSDKAAPVPRRKLATAEAPALPVQAFDEAEAEALDSILVRALPKSLEWLELEGAGLGSWALVELCSSHGQGIAFLRLADSSGRLRMRQIREALAKLPRLRRLEIGGALGRRLGDAQLARLAAALPGLRSLSLAPPLPP